MRRRGVGDVVLLVRGFFAAGLLRFLSACDLLFFSDADDDDDYFDEATADDDFDPEKWRNL